MTEIVRADVGIIPLVAPESMDSADADGFREFVRLDQLACRDDAGHDHFDYDPVEALPAWHDQSDQTVVGFLAVVDGAVVGAARMQLPNEPGTTTVEFDAFPDPARWGEGIEDALFDRVEREAADRGRSILQTWTLHRPDSTDEVLPSPTGFGGVPLHDRQTEFLLRRGYSFEQCERNSVFDLRGSFTGLDALLANAHEKAGDDYRVVLWSAPTPAEYADGFAYALSRMATDVPSGALVWEEETWDAARVARRDARMLNGGHTVSVAAALHMPSGKIVAFNELVIGTDHTRATHQYGTLVLKEHRGHRLGMLVKGENLRRWRELVPESPRVSTFNAEENRPMLDINEALGFVPASYAGAWKKVLG